MPVATAHAHGIADAPSAADAGVALLLLAPVLAGIVLYLAGLARLWRRRAGSGVSMPRAMAGVAGWSLLTGALTGPLDRLAESSFAVHMVQHMILLAAVPPLLLLGRAGAVMLAGCSAPLARALAQRWRRAPAWRSLLAQALRPSVAALVQTLLLWGWHLPAAIDAAARDDVVHYAMHASLFAAGLLFWASLSRSLRAPEPAARAAAAWSADASTSASAGAYASKDVGAGTNSGASADTGVRAGAGAGTGTGMDAGAGAGAGAGMIALVATMMQMGFLGALLVFAGQPLFERHAARAHLVGLSPLEDQQLAGLVMWVPGAIPYLLGGLALMSVWLRRSERRTPTPVSPARRTR